MSGHSKKNLILLRKELIAELLLGYVENCVPDRSHDRSHDRVTPHFVDYKKKFVCLKYIFNALIQNGDELA